MTLVATKNRKVCMNLDLVSAKVGFGLACLLLLSQSACGQDAPRTSYRETEVEREELREEVSPSLRNWQELAEKFGMKDLVNLSLDEIQKDTCFQGATDYERECSDDFEEVRFSDGRFDMETSTGEAILVGEDFVDALLTTTRYRARTKAFYTVKDGKLEPYNQPVRIPKTLVNIAKRFSGPKFYPAHALEILNEPIDKSYPGFAHAYTRHNTPIIEMIYEYNPHSPVVAIDGLGDILRLFDKDAICGDDSIDAKSRHMSSRSEKFANNLSQIIDSHNIRFASLSFGIWHDTTLDKLRRLCQGQAVRTSELNKLTELAISSLKPIFEVLGNTPNLMTAQSAPYQGSRGPYDCNPELQSTVFVGSINKPYSKFGDDGSGLPEKSRWTSATNFKNELKSQFKAYGECADIYVNFNLLRDKDLPDTLMASLGFGMGMGRTGRLASTSEAAPLALAKMIFLRQTAAFKDRPFDQTLVRDLKDALTPKACPDLPNEVCIFQDPIKYRQTSIHSHDYW